ncbi:MAG: hypothetical protein LR008_03280 [Candidatus Pacebacteria bacterium]|nr:hypothetical protein [Candidatus Paceibacterota bacterium]
MDWGYVLNFIYETAYFLAMFGLFTMYAIFKGRQAIMNVMVGLYLALLISIEFPAYEQLFGGLDTAQSLALAKLAFFAAITFFTTALFFRIMPDEFREEKFETLGKKLLLAAGATILVMIFSFHVLPVTEFLTPGTPLQSLFAPANYFFYWLLMPLVILYIL